MVIKILKYCTGSSARSYQCKYAVNRIFSNKSIESMEEVGGAIKDIIHYSSIKFSSVHADLAAEGIIRVEVGEEGLHFISDQQPGELFVNKTLRWHAARHLPFESQMQRSHALTCRPL